MSGEEVIRTTSNGCDEELDTVFKDKQETQQRFHKIDERFSTMEEKMDKNPISNQ